MEQILFFHRDKERNDQVLSQALHTLAQRLVLVVPLSTDRQRLSMLLRLIRRSASQRAQQLYLVSEDYLLRILAERMGYSVAATLDAYRGLKPGNAPSTRKPARQTPASPSFPATRPAPNVFSGQRTPARTQKPGAQLEAILVDGYLPNPGAIPSLEEEEERAERAERAEQERLSYEIADENTPSQAEEEAEAHEESIVATIRKTSALGSQTAQPSSEIPLSPDPPGGEEPSEPGARKTAWDGQLRPMRTIDELLAERGQAGIFEWFARQVDDQQKE